MCLRAQEVAFLQKSSAKKSHNWVRANIVRKTIIYRYISKIHGADGYRFPTEQKGQLTMQIYNSATIGFDG